MLSVVSNGGQILVDTSVCAWYNEQHVCQTRFISAAAAYQRLSVIKQFQSGKWLRGFFNRTPIIAVAFRTRMATALSFEIPSRASTTLACLEVGILHLFTLPTSFSHLPYMLLLSAEHQSTRLQTRSREGMFKRFHA